MHVLLRCIVWVGFVKRLKDSNSRQNIGLINQPQTTTNNGIHFDIPKSSSCAFTHTVTHPSLTLSPSLKTVTHPSLTLSPSLKTMTHPHPPSHHHSNHHSSSPTLSLSPTWVVQFRVSMLLGEESSSSRRRGKAFPTAFLFKCKRT